MHVSMIKPQTSGTCGQHSQEQTATASTSLQLYQIQEVDIIPHHSVPICDRYVDNMMALYHLRCPSGHLLDYTMYMYYTH